MTGAGGVAPAATFTATADQGGVAEYRVTGRDAEAVIVAGLNGLLALARGATAPPPVPEGEAAHAAAIRGQGPNLPTVFRELASDLLARLDEEGTGLDRVRLDGLLATADGYSAWGYALGDPNGAPPVPWRLVGDPTVIQEAGRLALRLRLARG